MRTIFIILLACCFITRANSQSKEKNLTYDICIYGATSAGVVAAYTAQQMGKTVVLISPDGLIGGMSSGGLGKTDIGNKFVIGGLSRQFYQRLGKIYGEEESWLFEPSAASKVFADYIKEGNLPVIYNKRISEVTKDDSRVKQVTLVKTFGSTKQSQTIAAKVFLDCTYEGDLLALAGVSYTLGREDNNVYGEKYSGFQLPEYKKRSGFHQFPDGVSPYKISGDSLSGLVWGISKDTPRPTGEGDKKVQAFNFRICLTDSPGNIIPIRRPKGYDPSKYELLARLFEAQPDMRKINDYFIWSLMPNNKTDINNRGGFSTDMIGANYNWPEGSFEERRRIFEEHISYTKGLLYFFTSDKRVPDTLRRFVSKWGYPKDEYVNNKNFTPQLYVREGRRMIGEYVMTEQNCTGEKIVEHSVGMAAYTMDSHNIQRIVVNGSVKNEGNVEIGGFRPYPISYKAITPKRTECTNLLVPVSLSASHIAFGSIRMEPVFMVLGQSAATAAVQAINENKAVQDINYDRLRQQLIKDKQILGL